MDDGFTNFHFVEIGTSNYETISQFLSGHDSSCPLAHYLRSWDCQTIRGIAVEPVAHLLNDLPSLPKVLKSQVAMGRYNGTVEFYQPKSFLGCKDFSHWFSAYLAIGCGHVILNHVHLRSLIKADGFDFLI